MPPPAPSLLGWPRGRIGKGWSAGSPPPVGPGPPALTLTCPKKPLSASSCQPPMGCWGCQSLSSAELTRISSTAGTRTCSRSWPCAPEAVVCVRSSLRVTPSCQEPAVRSCRQEIKEPSAFQSLSLGTGEGQGTGRERQRERGSQLCHGVLHPQHQPTSGRHTGAACTPPGAGFPRLTATARRPAQAAQNADAQKGTGLFPATLPAHPAARV